MWEFACYVVREEVCSRRLWRLFLIIAVIGTQASALSDQREASLKRPMAVRLFCAANIKEAERLLTEALQSGALLPDADLLGIGGHRVLWRWSDLHAAIDDFNALLRLSKRP